MESEQKPQHRRQDRLDAVDDEDNQWEQEYQRREKEDQNKPVENQEKSKAESAIVNPMEAFPLIAQKIGGFEFFANHLKSPRKVLAPMVNQSELPFRLLCRKYGADLCYTPMFHSKLFATDAKYRKQYFSTCPEDRPLVVQFCANDPQYLVRAAKFVENDCDAVDINFGCPQGIARSGNYGAFLMEQPEVIKKLIKSVHDHIKVPVFCKIRIFPTYEETLAYAKMIEAAGCQLLTVHGRTRVMKGPLVGLADWEVIRKLKQELSIPVVSNGNIQSYEDYERCMEEIRVDGVMSAEGLLRNPALFTPTSEQPSKFQIAYDYLDFCKKYPTKMVWARGHLFKIFEYHILKHEIVKMNIFQCYDVDAAIKFVQALEKYLQDGDDRHFARDEAADEESDKKNKSGSKFAHKFKSGKKKRKVTQEENVQFDLDAMV